MTNSMPSNRDQPIAWRQVNGVPQAEERRLISKLIGYLMSGAEHPIGFDQVDIFQMVDGPEISVSLTSI